MKLKNVKVKNFRSIDELEIDIHNFTSLIGPNNAGKSTILRAIQLFLDQEKPEVSEWPNNNVAEPIIIEAIFDELKEWERTRPGVAGLVYNNKIHLRYIAEKDLGTGKISIDFFAFKPEETILGWSDTWAPLSAELKAIATGIGITSTNWKSAANKERVKEKLRVEHSEMIVTGDPRWTDESISINSALQQALPQAIYVPAITDASEATKPTSKNTFGKLLSKIIIPAMKRSDEYGILQASLTALKAKLNIAEDSGIEEIRSIMTSVTERLSSVFSAKVILKMEDPDFEKILSSVAGITIDDGAETPIHLQGHGVQRAVVFALIETIAKETAANREVMEEGRSSIFLFEEPELFMHPHLMRRMRDSLWEMSRREDFQVVITTHSPILVNVAEDPRSLVIFSRESQTTSPRKKQLISNPFSGVDGEEERDILRATLDFHPTVCEAFFAKRTILVEGDTEKAILSHSNNIYEVFNISSEKVKDTTVVSCGGKWTISPIAKLLSSFGIPFRVIHDLDAKGRTAEELAICRGNDPFRANEKIRLASNGALIHLVSDTFENLIFADGEAPSKDKPYKSWKKILSLHADTTTSLAENQAVKDFFIFAYDW